MYYLDLILLLNGAMDGLILLFAAWVLRIPLRVQRFAAAVLCGSLPVLLVLAGPAWSVLPGKVFVLPLMAWVGLGCRSWRELFKGMLAIFLATAVWGGLYYALSGWFGWQGLWLLLPAGFLLAVGYIFWERKSRQNVALDLCLREVEIDFGNGGILRIKGFLDTGNRLMNPFSGEPVLLVEEEAAKTYVSAELQDFLRRPWRQSENPWSFVWQESQELQNKVVFLKVRSVIGQSWLLGWQEQLVKISGPGEMVLLETTIGFAPEALSGDGRFQALLQIDHLKSDVRRRDLAS